jgi:alkaline phosphatase D
MPEAKALFIDAFPDLLSEDGLKTMDAARTYNDGNPPEEIRSADGRVRIPNIWKHRPPKTVLGLEQKTWFLDRLRESKAIWKIWGNTTGTLQMRADPENLPSESGTKWPWNGYAAIPLGDWSTAYAERAEIYDFIRKEGITGFVTVAGDRHSFWAGLATKSLPPDIPFPVGIAFVTGSISAPGLVEAYEHSLPKDHPLRALYVGQGPKDQGPQPIVNLLLHHGVKSCLEYAKTGDIGKARALTNPDLAPHVAFVDMGGHGYSVVRATSDAIRTEFVCIPRPLERSEREDGGPIAYRVQFESHAWKRNEPPRLKVRVIEGDPKFSI